MITIGNVLMLCIAIMIMIIIIIGGRELFILMNNVIGEIRNNNEYFNYYFSIIQKDEELAVSKCMAEIERMQPDGTVDHISVHMDIQYAMQYRVGDIFILNRDCIEKSSFYRSLDKMHLGSASAVLQDDYTFGRNGNRCSVKILERIFHDGYLELQAKIIPEWIEDNEINNIK